MHEGRDVGMIAMPMQGHVAGDFQLDRVMIGVAREGRLASLDQEELAYNRFRRAD